MILPTMVQDFVPIPKKYRGLFSLKTLNEWTEGLQEIKTLNELLEVKSIYDEAIKEARSIKI